MLGPSLDGIHGRVHLLTYDSGQFDLGDVESSGWVVLLLGTFYAVIGSLHVLGDLWLNSDEQQEELYDERTVPFVFASIG